MDYNASVRRIVQRLQRELGRNPSENEINAAMIQEATEASRGNAPPVRNFNANLRAVLAATRREEEAKRATNEDAALRSVLEATRREAEAKRVANEEAALRAVLEATRREEEARIRAQEEANMKAVLEANRPEEELIKGSLRSLLSFSDPNMRTAALYFVELENLLKSHPEWIRTQGGIRKIIFEIQEKLQSMLLSDTPLDIKFIVKLPTYLISNVYGPTGVKRSEFLAGNEEYQVMKALRNGANAANNAKAKADAEAEARAKVAIEEGKKKLALERKEEEVRRLKETMNSAQVAFTSGPPIMKGTRRAKNMLNTAKAAYEKARQELENMGKGLKGGKITNATRKLKKRKTRSSK
jgi:hypothetical protein